MIKELQDIEHGAVDGVIVRLQDIFDGTLFINTEVEQPQHKVESIVKELLGKALRPWIKIAFESGRVDMQAETIAELTAEKQANCAQCDVKQKAQKVLEKKNA